MNYLILKYRYPITAVILVIFAVVIYRRASQGFSEILVLGVAALVVWVAGAAIFIYVWPRITVNGYKRALVGPGGFGGRPIPVNTLYAEPSTPSASASRGSLMATGTDHLLYIAGWLELRNQPQLLQVPDMAGRYFSLQFTNPSDSANFAYVGTRTTGTGAGNYLLSGPGWNGSVPEGSKQIAAPGHAVLVIGRVFVEDDNDRATAYELAQQIRLAPLDR